MLNWLAEQIVLHWDILKYLIPAIPVTVLITICSFSLAMVLGLIIGVMRISRIKLISNFASTYINVIRGIPLLVQIFFIYFGLGKFLNLDRFTAGVLAVGICYSAYLAEIFRSGINAIARGQHAEPALRQIVLRLPDDFRLVVDDQDRSLHIPPQV